MITYSSENVKFPNIKRRETTAWIRRVAATYGKKVGEVGYLFCDDEHILAVNREYLQHDYYTDIITFDYCEDDVLNGDLVISLDTVRTNAELFTKTTMKNCTALSSMVFYTFVVKTIRDQESVSRWRQQRIRP